MAPDAVTGNTQTASCPHCHKPFSAALIAGGAERHRGFKCPHCKLFVPESRAEDAQSRRPWASGSVSSRFSVLFSI